MVQEVVNQETQEAEIIAEEIPAIEDVGVIKAELEQLKSELVQTKKGLSTAHQTLTEKDKEIKRRADLEGRIDGLQDTLEVLATAIASKGEEEELDSAKRQDILADIKRKRDEQQAKIKQRELTDAQTEYAQKADALYARAMGVFGDDDDNIERIEDLLMNGRIERAEARVIKAEQKKAPGKTPSGETEDQRIERLAEEKYKAHLVKAGLLDEFSSSPPGGSKLVFTEEKIGDPDYWEANKAEILKAQSEPGMPRIKRK